MWESPWLKTTEPLLCAVSMIRNSEPKEMEDGGDAAALFHRKSYVVPSLAKHTCKSCVFQSGAQSFLSLVAISRSLEAIQPGGFQRDCGKNG